MRLYGILLLLATVGVATYVKKDSSFVADAKARQGNCGKLLQGGAKSKGEVKGPDNCDCDGKDKDDVVGSGSGSGSGSGDYGSGCCSDESYSDKYGEADLCVLFKLLIKVTPDLPGHDTQVAWVKLIDQLQEDVIFDSVLSDEEKLVKIQGEIDIFIEKYAETKVIINYIYVDEWEGYVADLEELTVDVQYTVTDVVIELDGNDDCPLFEALRNASKGNSELEGKVETLIKSLTATLKKSESSSSKLVEVYSQLDDFFKANTADKATILAGEIEEYGTISVFCSVASYYWRISNYSKVIGGDASSCPLITQLTQAYQQESTGSKSQRAQIKQLAQKLTSEFDQSTAIKDRVSILKQELYQFLILEEWSLKVVFSLELSEYGSIGQLIAATAFEEEANVSFDSAGDCSTATKLTTTGTNSNTSLTISLQSAVSTWSISEQSRFVGYFKRIIKVQQDYTGQDCINEVVKVFNNWTKDATAKQKVYDIDVYNCENNKQTSKWGKVQQFCSCAK
ncbi:unnamed protein product [Bursaphelenchus xylophilus]|uniref:(pine wood nematode) hypothetical protein n=1 Tax=Bursaphelenchus xylophilus TaxID=6326 RepID=A0A1I7RUK5_BURXY|nr:unnamed protein product [Bursaphelenchus xylophilus]CAG9114183.1 unnamed protein product [Bursaphelenchus xylophilus]